MNLDVENNPFRRVMIVVGPVLAGLVAWSLFLAGHSSEICWTAAITVLCAAWWVTEAIPIPATSLIPMALLPLTGVLDHKVVANAYGHYLILLLMGGFMLSKAMEKSGAHEKVALVIIRLVLIEVEIWKSAAAAGPRQRQTQQRDDLVDGVSQGLGSTHPAPAPLPPAA